MSDIQLKPLPLSCSGFPSLRNTGKIYVDKTDLIHSLCQYNGAQIFLARPRRFGKSLLVSTFESLFEFGLRDFKGLAIEKLWNDNAAFPVVHLDFSAVKEFINFKSFEELLDRTLVRCFKKTGFVFDPASQDDVIGQIDDWMDSVPDNSLVVLVDEYDAPLATCLHQPELFEKVQTLLSRFFLMLKARSMRLRFLFMTGVTKLSNTGIFSGLNNLEDISLESGYGTLLGYTESEILSNFGPHLERAAEVLGISKSTLLNSLRFNYDGFCFDRKASAHVYCPWSVLNFLKKPAEGFENYWYSSGGNPSVLLNYLKTHHLKEPMSYQETKRISLDELSASQPYAGLDENVLLAQTGYLTIKQVSVYGNVTLGYPNNEVASSLARLYARELLGGKVYDPADNIALKEVLAHDSLDKIVSRFNAVFNLLDYQNYPVSDEASCRSHLQMLMTGAEMVLSVEVHSALGRSDLEVDAGSRHWVFEIKYARTSDDADALLQQGIEQVRSRRYGEAPRRKELLRAVLVFDGSARAFSRWTLVDQPEEMQNKSEG